MYDIGDSTVNVNSGHSLTQPVALHHSRRHGPNLEVVWAHENVCDTGAHDSQNPLIKVLGLSLGDGILHLSLHQPSQALDLIIFVQSADVVLEWIRHIAILHPNIGHTLQGVPCLWASTKGCVQQLVKVVPVTEDHMATHVKQEALGGDISAGQTSSLRGLINEQPIRASMLVEAGGSTQSRGTRTNDENVDLFSSHVLIACESNTE
mmetsp:Transcript_25530/g.55578  ORF Transcript_25530/g.55578 Transcript_25530/m.55578 type:complete len:207 (+) Transcript_25530:1571-2191(+)